MRPEEFISFSIQIKEMPDDWFSQKEEVPYLYLSDNPWSCSCSLLYLRRYLSDYELNVYVRDGPIIESDVESVVCTSPPDHKGKSIINLEDYDLCPPPDLTNPRGDSAQAKKATEPATTVSAASTTSTTTASTSTSAAAPSPSVPAALEDHKGSTLVESRSTIRSSSKRFTTMTTRSVSSTSTPNVQVVTATTAAEPWATGDLATGTGGFCVWLFAGCLLLCVASAACILATVARLVMWYTREYELLKAMLARQRGGGERARPVSRRGEKEVTGGAVASYRSVLFIHRDGGQERTDVPLEPAGGHKEGGETGVYKETIYRLVSREEEVGGWRDVMEECRRTEGERGGDSRKRYSVILREEREEGREQRDWVVGGWEVKRGGREEPRSSWGEWLAHYLPSMPWGVTMPTDGEAVH
ncbi:uncharacterized protein [Brachionichthys hirsutus]|uniref:uncharacterized protein n=1 Tax=Brachionichthys hirsutus TaxID=412623 RepID=UPI0036043395